MDRTASYVGPDDVHGSTVVSVDREGARVTVRLATDEGRVLALCFTGVAQVVCAKDVAGHRLHALVEVDALDLRRFVFLPEDPAVKPKLEVLAESLGVVDGRP